MLIGYALNIIENYINSNNSDGLASNIKPLPPQAPPPRHKSEAKIWAS